MNQPGKFFVHYFTKKCTVLDDAQVPGWTDSCSVTVGVDPAIGDPALREMFIIAMRDYIAQGTQRGPDPAKILTPRTLTFTPQ